MVLCGKWESFPYLKISKACIQQWLKLKADYLDQKWLLCWKSSETKVVYDVRRHYLYNMVYKDVFTVLFIFFKKKKKKKKNPKRCELPKGTSKMSHGKEQAVAQSIFSDCESKPNPSKICDCQSKSESTFQNRFTIQSKSNHNPVNLIKIQ
jgi:hypothetical protein